MKNLRIYFFIALIYLTLNLEASALKRIRSEYGIRSKEYQLNPKDPIDVIIPCVAKDLSTLRQSIAGIRKYCVGVRRIIIVSPSEIEVEAEWFSENLFPFNKFDIAYEIFQNKEDAENFIQSESSRIGWIYQQLLKLYASFVIPGLSSNVLILDADTIFIKKTHFMNKNGTPFFVTGDEYHLPYFEHMKRVLPWMQRVDPRHSGIVHHMLFQRSILSDFFFQVETTHKLPLWKALSRCIDIEQANGSCLSEYEMYFNFCMINTNQFAIRQLKWANISSLKEITTYKKQDYSFVSCHSYGRID